MTALALLLAVPIVLWIGQTILLRGYGRPIRWRIDSGDVPRAVRTGGRILTQLSLIGVIVVYPLLLGESVLAYYRTMLPATRVVLQGVQGAAASALCLCVLYGIWIATGCVQLDVHQTRKRWMRRLALLLPTALLGAFVEELLFRGVLMADLLRNGSIPPMLVLAIAATVFAAAHYVRSVKRRWTFGGHLMLGVLLCAAFLQTGTLWLSIGLHAGGNAIILGTRPFVRYKGPAWMTGASVFPYAGAVGILGLGLLTAFVFTHYGPR